MNRCFIGDCRDTMRELIAEGVRVQMCVTSPPYWGLRDYGVPPSLWGGSPECLHEWGAEVIASAASYEANSKVRWNHRENGRGEEQAHMLDRAGWERKDVRQGQFCQHCGAWSGALGLEPTPEMFVLHIVEVFRLVRELLADDGVLWLNLGDSYATGGGAVGPCPGGGDQGERFLRQGHINTQPNRMPLPGLKPKDLVGIPWRVAFALQADGWYLRSDIIWSKPNPMPESVTDRPTKSHEYLFLLSKKERYYYDQAAIREPYVRLWDETNGGSWAHTENQPKDSKAGNHSGAYPMPKYTGQATKDYDSAGAQDPSDTKRRVLESMEKYAGANKRTVWTVSTKPYAGAHFATFPPELIEPCILAGSRPGDIVFDPFFGSGTTGEVAQRLGRQWIGCELNGAYEALQRARTAQQGLVLA